MHKLRFFACFCLASAASNTFFNGLLSVERDALIGALFNRAMEGDTKAAQFLLAARHGMTEKQVDQGNDRVNITFQLPAALNPEQYAKLIQSTTPEQPAKITNEH